MWIYDEDGHLSVVQHNQKPDILLVRARDEASLKPLAEFTGLKIKETPSADYEYRVEVTKEIFSQYLAEQISKIEYPNFKNHIYSKHGRTRASIYGDVYYAGLSLENEKKYGKRLEEYDADFLARS